MSSAPKLTPEELRSLKAGEIITGPDGKKYRVKKTVLPSYLREGPHNIGDPDDRSLRKLEAEVLVPNMMNRRVETVDCKPEFEGLVACMRRQGGVNGLTTCADVLDVFNQCKKSRFSDAKFRQEVTNKYIEDRSMARRTGMSEKERHMSEFREWKAKNEKL